MISAEKYGGNAVKKATKNYKFYAAHETGSADIKMIVKMILFSLLFGLCIVLVIHGIRLVIFDSEFKKIGFTSNIFSKYCLNKFIYNKIPLVTIRTSVPVDLKQAINQETIASYQFTAILERVFEKIEKKSQKNLLLQSVTKMKQNIRLSWVFLVLFSLFYNIFFIFRSRGFKNDEFIRGNLLLSKDELIKIIDIRNREDLLWQDFKPQAIQICGIPIPKKMEYTHTLILGTTGVGKSVLLNQIIDQINQRKQNSNTQEKMVLYDPKGEFVAKHYDPTQDLIFYPFDQRSLKWSFMNEIWQPTDIDILATSLYEPPKSEQNSEYWYNAARDVFSMGIYYLYQLGKFEQRKITNREIVEFFNMDLQRMKICFSDIPKTEQGGLKHISKEDAQASHNIISILQERISFFKYLADMDGDFSFRRYIHDHESKQNLFLLNIDFYAERFKPLITFVIDTMCREILSLEDVLNPYERTTHVIIDELRSLGKMSSLFKYQTMARSRGGTFWVANQDLGSVETIYGKSDKSTFFNNFNITVCFRMNDPDQAEMISNSFGESEIMKKYEGMQFSPDSMGDRRSLNTQEKKERVVLPVELGLLRIMHAFLNIRGYGLTKLKIEPTYIQKKNPEFSAKKEN
jgi:GTPase SAR1 family protein